MSWTAHINTLKGKLSSLCGMMRKVSPFVPKIWMENLYFSTIHSRLQYLVAIWGLANKSNLRELQVMQNRCLKTILGKPYLSPTIQLYSNCNDSILPIRALHEIQILVQVYNILSNRSPLNNTSLRRMQHSRASRQLGNFVLVRPNTEYGRKKFTYIASKLYNDLPAAYKSLNNVQGFKLALKKAYKLKIAHFLT